MKNGTDRPTEAQMAELASHVHGATASTLSYFQRRATFDQVQALLTSGAGLRALVRRGIEDALNLPSEGLVQSDYLPQRKEWMRFYSMGYGAPCEELAYVQVPPRPPLEVYSGELMLVFVLRGLTHVQARQHLGQAIRILKLGEGVFSNCSSENHQMPHHARHTDRSYAVWVERDFYASNHFGQSQQDIDPEHDRGVTLLEELLILHYQLIMSKSISCHVGKSVLCTGSWSNHDKVRIPHVGYSELGSCTLYYVLSRESRPFLAMRRAFA